MTGGDDDDEERVAPEAWTALRPTIEWRKGQYL